MVQVFDPTDGNMTPCTESLRYPSYVRSCGLKWGKVLLENNANFLSDYFIVFHKLNSQLIV